jgi:hypothetical protein
MTNVEKKHFLDYKLCNGITPLLFNWINVYWPQDQKMKLIAIKVNKSEIGTLDNYPETLPQTVNNSSARKWSQG